MKKYNQNRSEHHPQYKHRFLLICSCFILLVFGGTFVWKISPLALKESDHVAIIHTNKSQINSAYHSKSEQAFDSPWQLILVNKRYHIPDGYKFKLVTFTNNEAVDKRIYPALQEMFECAQNEDIHLTVTSGFRTITEQQQLMDDKINAYQAEGYSAEQAKAEAKTWVAIPGASEHQLGLAVDLNGDNMWSSDKEAHDWLAQNAHRFGFILRYPMDKIDITGVSNEPWHYRYVGVEAAAEIYEQEICLEEYLNESSLQ